MQGQGSSPAQERAIMDIVDTEFWSSWGLYAHEEITDTCIMVISWSKTEMVRSESYKGST